MKSELQHARITVDNVTLDMFTHWFDVEVVAFLMAHDHGVTKDAGPYAAAYDISYGASKAWLTIKGQPVSTLSRPEWEYEIPVADANEMARQPGAYSLEKTRYFIEHHGHMFEVDRYHGGLEGLYSVEVEMDSEKAQITLPDWVGEEVTGNKAWDNESLARNGWPT